MKIFIFGSNGMLGTYLTEYLSDKFNVVPISRKDFDLTQDFSLIPNTFDISNEDLIINASGIIKQREYSPQELIRVNSLFPHFLSTLNCKVIHITTDCVFSGKDGKYDEDSLHDCLDDYGKSKSLGEPRNICVIRTSIIGEEINNKKSLIEWVKSNRNKEINGYIDHFWNGVTCLELSKYIENIIDKNKYWEGVRHIHSPDTVSKYQLVSYINDVYSLGNRVIPTLSYYCNRSLSSKYESHTSDITKTIYDQIVELEEFEKFKTIRKLEKFPTINFISIKDNQNRIDKLIETCNKYNVKYNKNVFNKCTSVEKIDEHLYTTQDGHLFSVEDVSTEFPLCKPSYVGAHMSHFRAIKNWYENTNEEYGFFCEDDLSFETVKYWNFTWEEFFKHIPDRWQTVQLSITAIDVMYFFQPEVHFRNRCWTDYSCTAYIIKREHAKTLLDRYYDNELLVFKYLGNDKDTRPLEFQSPYIETCIYSTFQENTNFIFPLFVENQQFMSSVWTHDEKNVLANDSIPVGGIVRYNESYEVIVQWWKDIGKNAKIDKLFSYI